MVASPAPRSGVLLFAHGTVQHVDELPAFVNVIRRGVPPPDGLLEELRERYEQIGGSPLLEITSAQARAVGERLGMPAFVAMRLWHPLLEEVLPQLEGLDRLCVLPLAPFSVHVYRAAAEAIFRKAERPFEVVYAEPWGEQPELVAAHARLIRAAVPELAHTEVVLTAHSLPLAALRGGDPYAVQFEASARAVERALGKRCHLAYQSQGAGGGEWLGPTVEETLVTLVEAGAERVALAPIGFLADHVETLYDLDVAAAEQARCLGVDFVRVPALNVDEGLIAALASVAQRALAGEAGRPSIS
jgi:ferrochelatase